MLNATEIMELQKLAGMEKFSKRTIAEELKRSKLIELLQCSPTDIMGNHGVGALADHLIAHGVTVQECGHWIKTETNSTCSKCGGNVVSWTGDYDGYERERGICLMSYCPHCGGKMMPQPPKGE